MLPLLFTLLAPALADEAEPPAAQPAQTIPVHDDGVVRTEGFTEIPDELSQELQRLSWIRAAYLADISEDATELLITTRFGSTYQAHLVQGPLGARTQLTFGEEPVRSPRFVPGERAITYLQDVGGTEAYQVVRMSLDTGAITVLTDGVARHDAALWAPDGSVLVYNGNRRNGRDMDIYASDGLDPASARILVEATGHYHPAAISPDGAHLVVQEYISINDSRLHLVDLDTGALEPLSPAEPTAAWSDPTFGPDGTLYALSDLGGEFKHLYRYDGGGWEDLSPDVGWDVEAVAASPDGRTLAWSVNQEGYGVLHLTDLKKGKDQVVDLPEGMITGLRFSQDTGRLALGLTGPSFPADVYLLDTRKHDLERWTRSEMAGFPEEGFVSPELFRYPSFDGLEIPCFLYLPEGKGPHPVVISIHGGPEGQARPYFSPLTQSLVARGFAVLVPNVRGSAGYGKSWLLMDNGFKREDSVKDIGALLDWVDTRDDLDSSRVGVRGGSYGGYMVLASLVHYGDRIVAGANAVGISSFVTFLENTKPYRQDLRRVEYGDERDPEMRAHLEEISPLEHAEEIDSALLVVHGANDPRVPVGEAEQIIEAVRGQGHEVWYVLARNEGHGFRKKENRDLYIATSVLFFEQHLKE